ncbi:MAG: hypothetical protein KAS53_03310 [Candidatus Cloacimonetes bacterium]|nr:hypothetical protein [Candidatus Cloacimonadota bacterium]
MNKLIDKLHGNFNFDKKLKLINYINLNETEKQDNFEFHWSTYLGLIEDVAFNALNLHKIYTYAYDLRPNLYPIFEEAGFNQESVLKEHIKTEKEEYLDVITHAKLNRV